MAKMIRWLTTPVALREEWFYWACMDLRCWIRGHNTGETEWFVKCGVISAPFCIHCGRELNP
jgi:hypothetical protein